MSWPEKNQLASDLSDATSTSEGVAQRDHLFALATAAAAGDADAASTLITHLGAPILGIVRKVLGRTHADVDDVAQDAVMAFLGSLSMFRGECTVMHFASRISLFTALGARRRLRLRLRWAEPGADFVEMVADEESRSPAATTFAARRRELIHRLLDELPEAIAESLALHFILGYTVEEIAFAVSVSPNTVWSRLRLGKRALRRRLQGDAQLAEMLELKA